jgi:hypothetical protein
MGWPLVSTQKSRRFSTGRTSLTISGLSLLRVLGVLVIRPLLSLLSIRAFTMSSASRIEYSEKYADDMNEYR